jgi:hypothetical protein
MNDRIHAWLDGELPFEALSAQERDEARALEARIDAVAARMAAEPVPDLTGRVMAALPAREAMPAREAQEARDPVGARLRAWLHSLVPAGGFASRPAFALAALALMVGFGLGTLVPRGTAPAPPVADVEADAAAPQVFVRFELEATGASDVRLAGSFSGWEASYEMTPVGPGLWTVTVPLDPGVHDYMFVVDGEHHVVDPYAPRVSDGFGGFSSRLALLTPQI